MSIDINQVVISGTINKEIREADVGDSHVVETELAFTTPGKDGPKEQWIELQAWNQIGEELARLSEGIPVVVAGSLHRRAWKDDDDNWHSRYSVKASSVQELGPAESPVKPPAEPAEEELAF